MGRSAPKKEKLRQKRINIKINEPNFKIIEFVLDKFK